MQAAATSSPADVNLAVQLGRLRLKNPIAVASGTFGYGREMEPYVELARLGAVIPKTVTPKPRLGNPPPRTYETASGMLNSIGLDNDGLEVFCAKHLPYLAKTGTAVIVNIAGATEREFVEMAEALGHLRAAGPLSGTGVSPAVAIDLGDLSGTGVSPVTAIELNISCPNVTGGVDFGIDPAATARLVAAVRRVCPLPVIAKLTPNVTDIVTIARAAADGGADAVSLVNTFQGMAIDWRRRKPILGGVLGGLSGPAIKPLALRMVWQVASAVDISVMGIGGIATIDDVCEFLVAGARAVQIGTATFYDPGVSGRLVDELPRVLAKAGVRDVNEIVGTLDAGGQGSGVGGRTGVGEAEAAVR